MTIQGYIYLTAYLSVGVSLALALALKKDSVKFTWNDVIIILAWPIILLAVLLHRLIR